MTLVFNGSITSHGSSTPLGQHIIKAFAILFGGRTDAWGQFPRYCKHEPVTLAHYERHLKGKVSLGIYPLRDDGTCSWIAADLDQPGTAPWHNGPDDVTPALRLMKALTYYGANRGLALEKTKSKGWRVWLFFSAPVLAKHVRRLFYAALDRSGLPSSVEVFPKQDVLGRPTPSNPHPVGNFVHLPYFGGGPSGPRCGRVFVNAKTLMPIPLEELLEHPRVFPVDALPLVLENLPKVESNRSSGHAPQEIADILSRTLSVGERRPTLVKLTGYLRYRGIPEEVAIGLLLPWAEKAFSEPLSAEEVERHIRGVYGRYGLGKSRLSKLLNSQALATILPQHRGKRRQR